jgi:hypothetical protein
LAVVLLGDPVDPSSIVLSSTVIVSVLRVVVFPLMVMFPVTIKLSSMVTVPPEPKW